MNLVLELGLRGSVVFLLVAVLDRCCASHICAASRRWWWLLVPVVFLAPVHLPLVKAPPLRKIVLRAAAEIPSVAKIPDAAESRPSAMSIHRPDWNAVLCWVWFTGAVGYLGVVVVRSIRVQRRWSGLRLSTDPALLDLLEDCKKEARITAPIGLVVSPLVPNLAILGWLHPRILVPAGLVAELSRERLRAVLLHELAHFHYADVPATWLFTLTRALHWPNPVAHFACVGWFNFREEAADEAAMRWMGERSGQNYGEILLQTLSPTPNRPVPFGALGIGESFGYLKKRFLLIKRYAQKSPCLWFILVIVLLLAGVTTFELTGTAHTPVPSVPDEAIWDSPKIAIHVPSSALDAIVGRFDYGGAIMTFTREGDRVFGQLGRQPRLEIYPKSETVFFWTVVDCQVAFIKNSRGEVVKVMHHQGGNTLIAQKLADIPVAKIDPTIFDAYVGTYKTADPDVLLTVSREGDRFFVQLTGQPKLEILPKSETEFFLVEINAQVLFVKNASGKAYKVVNHQNGLIFECTRGDSS